MMLLVCSLVGQKRSAFAIEVDENKMVDALKKAIKKEKENYLKAIDADELQLFLAKKGDGKWLDSRAVEALTLDGDGHPVGFMHMDPSLWIKNPKNFGERFEFKEGEIHVLVVVPKKETSTLIVPSVFKERQTIITLFCTVVGQKGSAFAIEVDINKTVDSLKDAIAAKRKYDFAADMLQLFLAKKGEDTWLDANTADALTTDTNGHPVGFMHMDPSLWIKNPKNFGERFEFKEGKIHILVVVPGDLGKIPSQIEFLAESESTWSADMLSVSLFPTDEMMEDSIPGYQWSELNEKQCVQINKKVTLSILKIT
jgi:Crinkler effector protein N-terminal domain